MPIALTNATITKVIKTVSRKCKAERNDMFSPRRLAKHSVNNNVQVFHVDLQAARPVANVPLTIVAGTILMLSGCIGSESLSPAREGFDITGDGVVVLALIDSGSNPYSPIFRGPFHPPEGSGATPIHLNLDDPPPANELAIWESIESNVLYHFEGTRLLSISMDEAQEYPTLDLGHGFATSYLAARAAPEAIIVMVQAEGALRFEDPAAYFADETIIEGLEWIADQDWIDVVSVSLGFPANPPESSRQEDVQRYIRASERAAASGKIIVNGAGNTIVPSVGHHNAGPPWIISVGGAEPESRGESTLAAKTSDVVANFSEQTPIDYEGTMDWSSGTSLATPIVAGTLATALDIVRKADPERVVTPDEIRHALNASAVQWSATDWKPMLHDRDTPTAPLLATDTPVLLPGQIGWGYVDSSLAPEIARRILEGDLDPPPEKAAVAAWQAQWQAAREAYWDNVG